MANDDALNHLHRAVDLMRHTNPTGDFGVVIERALELLVAKLETEKRGTTARPRKEPPAAKPERVTAATRREVFARDGDRCSYVDPSGNRCPARGLLELDHVVPRARGGSCDAENLRVCCKPHNQWYAEQVFGRAHVATARRLRQERQARNKARLGRAPAAPAAPAALPDSLKAATIGLREMGFKATVVRDALEQIQCRYSGGPITTEVVVREALALLT